MTNLILAHYTCTQSELYTVCETGWNSFQLHEADFSAKKAYLNHAFSTAALDEIKEAESLPDVFERSELAKSLRIQLTQAAGNGRRLWQLLKLYIVKAFSKEFHDVMFIAAGANYYKAAKSLDWDAGRSLLKGGDEFIEAHMDELTANSNMPAGFATEFSDARDNFLSIYSLFLNAENAAFEKTQAKIAANNAVYDKFMEMLKFGQYLYADNPAVRRQFVFDSILELVSSSGNAGLKGVMLNGNTSGTLPGVTLSLFEGTNMADAVYTTVSEEGGVYDFGGIASGVYTLKMECEGFVTKEVEVEIEVGVTSSKTFTLLVG